MRALLAAVVLLIAASPAAAQPDGVNAFTGAAYPEICPGAYGCYVAPDGRTAAQLVAAHVLPDRTVTPGAINPLVTQDNIATTVCRAGWTATVRPSTSYTNKLRAHDTPAGQDPAAGEEDHDLSIEDGGAPADSKNLWWMVYADPYGARLKDVLETNLKRRICSGAITLDEARSALLGNWLVAYVRYVGPLPN